MSGIMEYKNPNKAIQRTPNGAADFWH